MATAKGAQPKGGDGKKGGARLKGAPPEQTKIAAPTKPVLTVQSGNAQPAWAGETRRALNQRGTRPGPDRVK